MTCASPVVSGPTGEALRPSCCASSGAIAVVEGRYQLRIGMVRAIRTHVHQQDGFARLASRIGTRLADRPRRSIRLGSSNRISQP